MKLNTSYHQKRLWFTDQFESGSLYESNPVYFNIPYIIKLTGKLDPSLLEKSIISVVSRHEALRTKIVTEAGESFQKISTDPVLSLNEISATDKDEESALGLALSETQKPLPLDGDSLFKAALVKFDTDKYFLALTAHNIICDRYSIKLIAGEIFTYYNSFMGKSEADLPELQFHFADFAQWQNDLSSSESVDPAVFYWKKNLAGKIPVLEIPYDIPRAAIHIYKYVYKTFDIPKILSGKIRSFCIKEGISFSVFFMAAYYLLLHKYSYQDDIIVGTYSINRKQEELQNVVGTIANLIPVRTRIPASEKILDLVKNVDGNLSEANANSDIPFDKLVLIIKPEKDMSRNPLFDVVYRYEDTLAKFPETGDLAAEVIETNLGFGKFDLNLFIQNKGETFSAILTSNLELFHEDTIERITRHFEMVLERMLDDPEKAVSELSLLSEEERDLILDKWNDTKAEYPKNKTIHQLFEQQSDRTPDNTAVAFGDKNLSYAELRRESDKLAYYLRNNHNVKRNDLICVLLDKSEYMIVSLLAILKAGGAYVPIDPNYPQDRINYILNDSRSKIIISSREHSDKFSAKHGVEFIDSDALKEKLKKEKHKEIDNVNEPGDTAYIIYTSGTTGDPKGCMISHKNIVRLMRNDRMPYDFNADDVWIMAHSFCFDFSVWEMYGALLYGGKLIVPKKDEVRDISEFLSLIKQNKVTVLNQTPLAFYNLTAQEKESGSKTLGEHLRYVIFGGDKLEPRKLRDWTDMYSLDEVSLVNMYGITETTVHVTFHLLTSEDISSEVSGSPIGKPIPETTVYVFDSALKLVPPGIKGEFYVGGTGVAKGYLFRDDLTAERFIKNPYKPSETIYKTGDEGFWTSDGNLEYLGRIDNQVKIRGFRIELGEIENFILGYGGINETVVLAREEKTGEKRLIAFIVADTNSLTTNELRQYLKDKLPDYMVPSFYVFLKQLPMTINGKIDKKALENTELTRNDLGSKYSPPQSDEEKILARIWQEVIGIDKVGVNDNFFELGGDSIMSIQIIARANQEGLKIIPKQIFQYQTIAELSVVLEYVKPSMGEPQIITGDVPLSPVQHWFFDQNHELPDHFNHSVLLKVPGDLNTEYLAEAAAAMMKHHDALRMSFQKADSGWKQNNEGIRKDIPFDVADFSGVPPKELDNRLENDIALLQKSLDLNDGSLIRFRLYKTAADKEDRLLIIIHHLAVDGISWRIILEDFYKAYHQLSRQEPVKLLPKSTSFKSWSRMLTDHAASRTLVDEMDYWLSLLETKVGTVPVDFPDNRDNNTIEHVETVTEELDAEYTQILLKQVPKAYNTQINDILLTALTLAYESWSKENRLLINLEGHGRESIFENADLSRTIGWFTTIFPVVLESYNSNDLPGTIKSIKENLRRIPVNGIGYGILKYLNPDKELREKFRSLPKAGIIFNYLGQMNENIGTGSEWKLGSKPIILDQGKKNKRSHILEINILIVSNRLKMDFTFSKNIHKKETIESFALIYKEELKNIIDHCTSPEASGYTPSDFSASGLSQQDLDKLIANLK